MKEKVFVFIIGVLVGAILATGAFYLYNKNNTTNDMNNMSMNGQPPEMPNGERPEMPSGENGQPPEKPSETIN